MAILQLSRITHRKGLDEDLPQLAGGELGWAIDNRKLYIGNGEIVDGAPVIGNTEILTEFSDVLGFASTYTYKGEAAGYVVETGENQNDILRSMQSKFDDFASVKDFGAEGDSNEDGSIGTDDTDAINRALYELFCQPDATNSATNPSARRSLYFPAGIYKVTGKIKVPPHAKLWGEGLTSSIIKFFQPDPISVAEIQDGERYQIVTVGTTDFTTLGSANNIVDTIFVSTISDPVSPGTGTVRPLPAVVETANNQQVTGINIGGGDQLPTGIEMVAMAIHSTEENSLLKLNSVTSSGFNFLELKGPNTDPLDPTLGGIVQDGTTAVEIVTTGPNPTHDITLNKLSTSGTTYSLRAEGLVKGVVLENSGLDFHYKGVYVTNTAIPAINIVIGVRYKILTLGDTDFRDFGAVYNRLGETFVADATGTGGTTGTVISMDADSATGVVASRNIMDNIAREGVHYENVLFNSTGYNVFYNVGNDLATIAPGNPGVYPVITFDTDQSISVGDLFERETESEAAPRVKLNGNGGIYTDGSHSIHLGSYERIVGLEAQIEPTATNETLFETIETVANSYKVDYNIAANTSSRMGTLVISVSDANVTYTDEYTEAGSVGVVLEAVSSGVNESEVQVTSSEVANAVINFSVVKLD